MKTLNNYDKYKFLNKELVYIGDSPNFTYGGIYKVITDYNISDDSEYRFYFISLLNNSKRWESVPGDKLVLLSDYRNNQLNEIGI